MNEWAQYLQEHQYAQRNLPSTLYTDYSDQKIRTITDGQKRHGQIFATQNHQFNLYMEQPTKHASIQYFIPRLEEHPLLAIGSTTEPKPQGNHISDVNYGLRTKLDFSVLVGYSAHGDPRPSSDQKQMTHLWCRCLRAPPDKSAISSAVTKHLCNLLAHVADFQLPFPDLFSNRGLKPRLSAINKQWLSVADTVAKAWTPLVEAAASSGSGAPWQRRSEQQEEQRQVQQQREQLGGQQQQPQDRERPLASLQAHEQRQREQQGEQRQQQQSKEQ